MVARSKVTGDAYTNPNPNPQPHPSSPHAGCAPLLTQDVHVDPSLFAFTIALSKRGAYQGGGTYFEHIDQVVLG